MNHQLPIASHTKVRNNKAEYPMHPLDLMTPITVGNDGKVWCKPWIGPIDSSEYGGESLLSTLNLLVLKLTTTRVPHGFDRLPIWKRHTAKLIHSIQFW